MIEQYRPPFERGPDRNLDVTRTLSQQEFSELLYSSFYYSQGNPNLQAALFHLIATAHPELRVPDISDEEVVQGELPKYLRFFGAKKHTDLNTETAKMAKEVNELSAKHGISPEDAVILGDLLEEVKALKSSFNDRLPVPHDMPMVLNDLISADYRALHKTSTTAPFESERRLRPTTGDAVRPTTGHFRGDMSHIAEYVIRENQGPPPVYSKEVMSVFREVLKTQSAFLTPEAIGKLKTLLTIDPAPLDDFPELKARIESYKGQDL